MWLQTLSGQAAWLSRASVQPHAPLHAEMKNTELSTAEDQELQGGWSRLQPACWQGVN